MKKETIEKIDKAIEKACERVIEADGIVNVNVAEETKALAELIKARASVKERTC